MYDETGGNRRLDTKYIIVRNTSSNNDYIIEVSTKSDYFDITQTGQNETNIKQNNTYLLSNFTKLNSLSIIFFTLSPI